MTIEAACFRIVCAAIKHPDGHIIAGPRHFDLTMHRQIELTGMDWGKAEQGFINTFGDFLNRKAAWVVADTHGQIIRDREWQTGVLHSEHLY